MSDSTKKARLAENDGQKKAHHQASRKWSVFTLLQLSYLTVTAALHLVQPDWSAALIVIPVWCWTIPAFLMLAIHIGIRKSRAQFVVLTGWLILNGIFFDSAFSLYREAVFDSPSFATGQNTPRSFVRVISFNCKDRLSEIESLKRFHPDVVLLQEAPGELDIMEARKTLFDDGGDYIWNPDCSVLVRGKILESFRGWRHTHAIVNVDNVPFDFRVVSMRLDRPDVRFDFWNIECWDGQSFKRKKQRNQIRQVLETLEYKQTDAPTIIGGDFNCLHGNNLLNPIEREFTDAHLTSGTGWGKTFPNEFPILRLDRIFYDDHWTVEFMATVPSGKSDHRILICDLVPIASKQ